MATKLIRLQDGTLMEAEVPEKQAREISGGAADQVKAGFEKIQPVLLSVCEPVAAVWKELNQKEMHIDGVEIQLGLSFEGEGNVFVTRAKTGAALTIKLTLKPPAHE